MRYTYFLLSCFCLPLMLFSAGFTQGEMEILWPQNGDFQIICAEEVLLHKMRITLTGKDGKLLYSAPENFIPPAATMLHAMGGNIYKGDRLTAGGKVEKMFLSGKKLNVFSFRLTGVCKNDHWDSRWKITAAENAVCVFTLTLSGDGKWSLKKDKNGNQILRNGEYLLVLHEQTGNISSRLNNDNESQILELTCKSAKSSFRIFFGKAKSFRQTGRMK